MNQFVMNTMPRVYFGEHCLKDALLKELPRYGKRVMLAYGGGSIKRNGIYDEVVTLLKEAHKDIIEFHGIMSNPTYQTVVSGAQLAKDEHIDLILAVGGGSVIDCCKMISAQAMIDDDIWDLERHQHQMPSTFIPMGAVVTASGTGSEMNNGAVITHEHYQLKVGMMGAISDFAVLDPCYTLSVPMKQVISGAFDTLSHCMETYFGQPLESNVSDEINEAIMCNTITHIKHVLKNPQDIHARSELMWDSAMAENGILKLGKVTDFQAHHIEHQLGAYTNCNHGEGLAAIHPTLYKSIYKEGITKFARWARVVWSIDDQTLTDEQCALLGIEALANFIKDIGLPTSLSKMGINDKEMLRKVADTCVLSQGCMKQLTHDDIYHILLECL